MGSGNVSKRYLSFEFMQRNAGAICYGVSVLIVAVLYGATYYKCVQEKNLELESITRDTLNISRAVSEHAIRTFEQASLLAVAVGLRYETDNKLDLTALTNIYPKAMSIFQQIAILNSAGIVAASSIPGWAPVDLSEREHFKVHVNSTTTDLFVSKPVLGKVSNKWSIQLTNRLVLGDKSFGGVVVVSLDPFYLSSFYKDIDIGPNGSIVLVGQDRVVRARKNMDGTTVGALLEGRMAQHLDALMSTKKDFEATDEINGQTMHSSIRLVGGFPLAVMVSISEQDALAGFYERRRGYYTFATSVSLIILLLASWMTIMFRKLLESANRHRIMFDNSPVGIMHIAQDGSVIDCNEKITSYIGSEKGKLVGFNLAEEGNQSVRPFVSKALSGSVSYFEGVYAPVTGGDAKYLRMVFNPVNVGLNPTDVIVTTEDISERMQAQEKIRIASERLQLATDASGIGIWDYYADEGALIWDDMMYRLYGFESGKRTITYGEWERAIHPDDLEKCRAALRRALGGKTDLSMEFRVVWGVDGSVHHIKANGRVRDDGERGGLRMVGTNLDITSMKKAEQELFAAYSEIEERVANRTQELAHANEMLQTEIAERKLAHREINQIVSSISSILIGVNRESLIVRWNDAAEHAFGLSSRDAIGKPLCSLSLPWDWEVIVNGIEKTRAELKPNRLYNIWYERIDGKDGYFVVTIGPLWNEEGGYDGYLILGDDISEVKFLEAQLAQAARLEAIGQLAAGIAHEINTPTQYVGDSVSFLKESFEDISLIVAQAEEISRAPERVGEETALSAKALLERIDADFLKAEIPRTITRIFEGIERITTIVQAMRRFSYARGEEKRATNINGIIENTLTISRNEWKYVANVETDFDQALTDVPCVPGEIGQVLLNIVINAAHAIEEVVKGTSGLGLISVKTYREGDFAVICVRDTGAGIPASVGDRVFNLFFTTKEVGKGTGQGLAIAYDIVVNKHGGSLQYESSPGEGTAFFVRLPFNV